MQKKQLAIMKLYTAIIVLLLLALTLITIYGGIALRSLITGIDYRVWPFYRRQQYKKYRQSIQYKVIQK